MFDADVIAVFYADWPASDVTWVPKIGGGGRGRAIHKHPGQVLMGDTVMQTEHTLRYQAITFPGVKVGDVFTIDGVGYTVSSAPQAASHGLEFTVELGRNGT